MHKYEIKKSKIHFNPLNELYNIKGSRQKILVMDKSKRMAMFKYERKDYVCSEACSEKLSYEIANLLGYSCDKIELDVDDDAKLGVLNYLFSDIELKEHTDAAAYLNIDNTNRKNSYTISYIKTN